MAVVRRNLYGLGVGLLALACGGGDGGTEPPGPPAQLVKNGTDPAPWYFNNPLPNPYSVTVRDAKGRGVPGVSVDWSFTTGDGTLNPDPSISNSSGVATTVHTLGVATTYVVNATVASIPATVTFNATASAPPTSAAVDVNDNFFSPASVVIKTGGTVTWSWVGSPTVLHNVTYTGGPTPRPPNGGNKAGGSGTFQSTITTVAKYDYVCTNHAGMTGTITVVN